MSPLLQRFHALQKFSACFFVCMLLLILQSASVQAATSKITAGTRVSCAIDSTTQLFCWGSDSEGQLGQGRLTESSSPLRVGDNFRLPSQSGQVSIAAGMAHSVALKADGSLWTWGANSQGQLGDGTTADRGLPKEIGTGFLAVAAGMQHSLALKDDGSLWAWGRNYEGQLGDGRTSDSTLPKQIGTGFSAVAAGGNYSLALKLDGSLWAWGANSQGQLGDGTTADSRLPKKIGTGFSAISAGLAHNLALKNDGSLWAWGWNAGGQLGDGTTSNSYSPKQIGTGFSAIAAAYYHSLALKTDGTLWAWGDNTYGGLGDGTLSNSSLPKQIGTQFSAIAGDYYHSLAIKTDGSLWSWGFNQTDSVLEAIPRANLPKQIGIGFAAVASGQSHSLAVKTDGSLWAWGSDGSGQLGYGASIYSSIPKKVGYGYIDLSIGDSHTLGVKSDGSVWAWGGLQRGLVTSPMQLPGLTDVVAVAAGGVNVALKGDGSVWMLRNISFPISFPTGSSVDQIGTGFSTIVSGYDYMLALKNDGSLWALGKNTYGQFGDGTTTSSDSLKQVGTGFAAVATNGQSVGLKKDGSLWVWGGDQQTGVVLPKQIGEGFSAIGGNSVGFRFLGLALKNDGSLWAWDERGFYGTVPTKIGLSGFSVISSSGNHGLALKPDGSVWAMGYNRNGVLGDGTLATQQSPVLVVNEMADGFLNLNPGTNFEVPPSVGVPFFVVAFGEITDASASVGVATKFNKPDKGKSGAVYVTARAPSGSMRALMAGPTSADRASGTYSAWSALNAADSYELLQLTSTGWQTVVSNQLIPYASGVIGDQIAAQTILNGTDTTNLKGAQFCVGYGTDADEMIAAGRMRVVATIPDSSATSVPTTSCIIAGNTTPVSYLVNLPSGWNLVGNSINQTLSVASLYNDVNTVISVWKWDTGTSGWQFYTPLMDTAALQTYAAGKGYGILSTINPGEGYWVNVKAQPSPTNHAGASFNLTDSSLTKGWNLVATGDAVTPSAFNQGLGTASLVSLWAWDNPKSAWYFYAPSLDASGTLGSYITGKGYLDFTTANKTLGSGTGFWINKP